MTEVYNIVGQAAHHKPWSMIDRCCTESREDSGVVDLFVGEPHLGRVDCLIDQTTSAT